MNRIEELLENQGGSQKWLSIQIGKCYNMANANEKNRQQPRLEVLFDIDKVLGIDRKELVKSGHE